MRTVWRWARPVKVMLVWVDPHALREFMELDLRTVAIGTRLAGQVVTHDPRLKRAADRLREALASEETGRDVLFVSLARVFLVTLVRTYAIRAEDAPAKAGGLDIARYRALVDFVATRLDRRIPVSELARETGMSVSHLGRTLRASLGKSPTEFVMEMRLHMAREMIADPSRTLSAIAAATGFSDQAHLTRSFKSAFGTPPGKYRKRLSAPDP